MAQVQDYYNPSGLYPSPPQSRQRFAHGLDSSASVYQYNDLTEEASMAQPLLQRQCRPQDHMQSLQWQMPSVRTPSMSNGAMLPQNQMWSQVPPFNTLSTWGGLATAPLLSKTEHSMLANSDLLYSHDARQNIFGKSPMAFSDHPAWETNGVSSFSRSDMATSPSADTLLSPVSPYSDVKYTYSPGPDSDHMAPCRATASYTMSPETKEDFSSPNFAPCMVPQQPCNASLQSDYGLAAAPSVLSFGDNEVGSTHDISPYTIEHSPKYSQKSSPGTTPWYTSGHTNDKPATAKQSLSQQPATLPFDPRPNSLFTSNDGSSLQRQAQWSNRNAAVPAQPYFQTRFMAPKTADADAERKADDETLLRMKQDGYTYKEIRKALRNRKVAESTLRGRYRSLTKPKKDRLRRPAWTETDDALLKQYVQDEFDKLDVTNPSLEERQKPGKVPWAKIVETIAANGGSYKFGASTAKRRWMQLTRPASTRSSRRRSQA